MKYITTSILFTLLASTSVFAADQQPAEQHGACKADIAKLCSSIHPGDGRIAECLKINKDKVSAPCKEQIAKNHPKKADGTAPAQ
jgi:hypothetical protein